ncbi:MAG: DegT/DnrJ/EryC1/StrS family aminotransferase, partial [Beijerinckiaceae bacterium]
LYGSMCDWDALAAIADKHGLILIEDSAEAMGSKYKGKRAGSFGRAAAFSFHGSKTVAIGEGGMFVTNHKDMLDRVLFLRDHGRPPGDRLFVNTEIGFKYRMSAVQAALGVAQMERIDQLIERKRAIFGWYHERLKDMNGIQLNIEPEGTYNSYWMVSVVPDASFGFDKFGLMDEFSKRNIDTRPFFSQLSSLPAFDGLPEAKRFAGPADKGAHAAKYGINLPSGYNVTEENADVVSRALREILLRT